MHTVSMIVVSGIIELDPANRDTAVALTDTLVAATLEEEGCISYGFWLDPNDDGRFRVFEEWKDQDALDAHFTEPHMAAFMEGLGSLGVRGTAINKYVVSDSSKLM